MFHTEGRFARSGAVLFLTANEQTAPSGLFFKRRTARDFFSRRIRGNTAFPCARTGASRVGSRPYTRGRPRETSYRGAQRLSGTVAIITGSDSGIGRAVAIAFAREGADLVLSFLPEERADAEETQRWVEEAGQRAVPVPGDIGRPEQCARLVQTAIDTFGRLDVVVNNAAFQQRHDHITEITADEWEHTFRTNIHAMFYLTKAAWPHLGEGAAVINTASIQAAHPSISLLAYASTKGAIVTFTKALAQEGAQQGVRVNAVAPGPVWTPLIPASTPAEQTAEFGSQNPYGRPAQPAELAPAYVFLASSAESSYVNGEVLGVHGGMPVPF